MKQINLNHYNDLKKKYEYLLKENEKLKAQIVRLESSGQEGHSYEHKNFLSEKKKAEPGTPFKEFFFNTKPVDQYSENHEKINLFTSLFRGRSDVYAKKWFSKKGVKGYSPVCKNEWSRGLCHKPKIKCSNCRNRSYEPIDESIIEGHLRGSAVIGIYPLMEDETCHFMAMDFDKDGWDKDAEIIRKTCADFNIPIAIEVSQSGNGCHVWFFFDEKISSLKAMKYHLNPMTDYFQIRIPCQREGLVIL